MLVPAKYAQLISITHASALVPLQVKQAKQAVLVDYPHDAIGPKHTTVSVVAFLLEPLGKLVDALFHT